MGLGDVRREDVLGAIALLDDPVERLRLVDELHFGPARYLRLVYQGRFYDSKAVVGIAHGVPSGREYLSRWDFTGGDRSVVRVLTQLGFYVDDGLIYEIAQLRVDQTHGRPAAYQYVVLLWAFARARSGLPRMVPFNDVRDELAQILAPFALAQTAPDPVMPWIALDGSTLWELQKPSGATSVGESEVKSLNLAGGLSVSVYGRVAQKDLYEGLVGAAIDVIAVRVGSESGFLPLLKQIGLADLGSITSVGGSPAVDDAIAAVESVSNPRRKFGRRLTAAENKAIEQRAVEVTRSHFEKLGFTTKDVGLTESYDVHASMDGQDVKVEVKGTTSDGSDIVLTSNEVQLHIADHPNNALAIVRHIRLLRDESDPTAVEGELLLEMPWQIDPARLQPIAYRYSTGL